ncbi:MAG: hypothetical protein HY078_07135 [Elusimicrobia bacterium]|nr:hypothetical protein [Elusimicrobiota bacterium]
MEPRATDRPRAGRFAPPIGKSLDEYGETAARLIEAGRLGKVFPDPASCASYLRGIGEAARAVYPDLRLSTASGLPSLQDLVRLQADREIAPGYLKSQQDRRRRGLPVAPRLAAKGRYYERLLGLPLKPLHRLDLSLRRVAADGTSAQYEAVLDRFDAEEAVFSRYTLLLEQTERTQGDALLQRVGDYSRQTAAFRERMEGVLRDESEIAFLILGRTPGVRVEEVARARIGPLWSPWTPGPAGWFSAAEGAFVLHLALDRTSAALASDRDDDPFSTLYRNALSDECRPLVEDAARQLGYRVHKDRKFACSTRAAAGRLSARLEESGTTNLVYCIEP